MRTAAAATSASPAGCARWRAGGVSALAAAAASSAAGCNPSAAALPATVILSVGKVSLRRAIAVRLLRLRRNGRARVSAAGERGENAHTGCRARPSSDQQRRTGRVEAFFFFFSTVTKAPAQRAS